MTDPQEGAWLDDEAGRLVRPYTVSNGRTRSTVRFNLLSLVMATGTRPKTYLGPDCDRVLDLCEARPLSVAEVAAHLHLPATVTKVLLSDLVGHKALKTQAPRPIEAASPPDRKILEEVLHGLRSRL
jgi:hypothetical protein